MDRRDFNKAIASLPVLALPALPEYRKKVQGFRANIVLDDEYIAWTDKKGRVHVITKIS